MKKRIWNGLFLGLASLAISACSGASPLKSAYVTELNIFHSLDTVRIMQVTDIHWHAGTDTEKQTQYLKDLVEACDPDIVVSTGDNFLGGNMHDIDTLISFFKGMTNSKGKKIYWTSTWGNHDRSGIYNPDYLSDLLQIESKHRVYDYSLEYESVGLYKDPKDDIHGRGNSLINLTDGEDVIWQLYCMDSNSDYWMGSYYAYDTIHKDEVNWFKEMADYSKQEAGETDYLPSLLFEHIPLYQVGYAYQEVKDGHLDKVTYSWGDVRESPNSEPFASAFGGYGVYVGYEDTGLFEAAKERGVRAIFCGHDHVNDFYAEYDGVYVGYGQKTGDQLYSLPSICGAKVFDLHKDRSFDGRIGHDLHVYELDYEGNLKIDPVEEVAQ